MSINNGLAMHNKSRNREDGECKKQEGPHECQTDRHPVTADDTTTTESILESLEHHGVRCKDAISALARRVCTSTIFEHDGLHHKINQTTLLSMLFGVVIERVGDGAHTIHDIADIVQTLIACVENNNKPTETPNNVACLVSCFFAGSHTYDGCAIDPDGISLADARAREILTHHADTHPLSKICLVRKKPSSRTGIFAGKPLGTRDPVTSTEIVPVARRRGRLTCTPVAPLLSAHKTIADMFVQRGTPGVCLVEQALSSEFDTVRERKIAYTLRPVTSTISTIVNSGFFGAFQSDRRKKKKPLDGDTTAEIVSSDVVAPTLRAMKVHGIKTTADIEDAIRVAVVVADAESSAQTASTQCSALPVPEEQHHPGPEYFTSDASSWAVPGGVPARGFLPFSTQPEETSKELADLRLATELVETTSPWITYALSRQYTSIWLRGLLPCECVSTIVGISVGASRRAILKCASTSSAINTDVDALQRFVYECAAFVVDAMFGTIPKLAIESKTMREFVNTRLTVITSACNDAHNEIENIISSATTFPSASAFGWATNKIAKIAIDTKKDTKCTMSLAQRWYVCRATRRATDARTLLSCVAKNGAPWRAFEVSAMLSADRVDGIKYSLATGHEHTKTRETGYLAVPPSRMSPGDTENRERVFVFRRLQEKNTIRQDFAHDGGTACARTHRTGEDGNQTTRSTCYSSTMSLPSMGLVYDGSAWSCDVAWGAALAAETIGSSVPSSCGHVLPLVGKSCMIVFGADVASDEDHEIGCSAECRAHADPSDAYTCGAMRCVLSGTSAGIKTAPLDDCTLVYPFVCSVLVHGVDAAIADDSHWRTNGHSRNGRATRSGWTPLMWAVLRWIAGLGNAHKNVEWYEEGTPEDVIVDGYVASAMTLITNAIVSGKVSFSCVARCAACLVDVKARWRVDQSVITEARRVNGVAKTPVTCKETITTRKPQWVYASGMGCASVNADIVRACSTSEKLSVEFALSVGIACERVTNDKTSQPHMRYSTTTKSPSSSLALASSSTHSPRRSKETANTTKSGKKTAEQPNTIEHQRHTKKKGALSRTSVVSTLVLPTTDFGSATRSSGPEGVACGLQHARPVLGNAEIPALALMSKIHNTKGHGAKCKCAVVAVAIRAVEIEHKKTNITPTDHSPATPQVSLDDLAVDFAIDLAHRGSECQRAVPLCEFACTGEIVSTCDATFIADTPYCMPNATIERCTECGKRLSCDLAKNCRETLTSDPCFGCLPPKNGPLMAELVHARNGMAILAHASSTFEKVGPLSQQRPARHKSSEKYHTCFLRAVTAAGRNSLCSGQNQGANANANPKKRLCVMDEGTKTIPSQCSRKQAKTCIGQSPVPDDHCSTETGDSCSKARFSSSFDGGQQCTLPTPDKISISDTTKTPKEDGRDETTCTPLADMNMLDGHTQERQAQLVLSPDVSGEQKEQPAYRESVGAPSWLKDILGDEAGSEAMRNLVKTFSFSREPSTTSWE